MNSAKRVNNKQELINLILTNKDSIKNYGVTKMGLFGSFVRDEAKPDSDVDLLVEMPAERKTSKNFLGLIYYLEEITGRAVTVATPQGLSPYIGPHILKELENVIS